MHMKILSSAFSIFMDKKNTNKASKLHLKYVKSSAHIKPLKKIISRTPKQDFTSDCKPTQLQKFKSNPTITYRELSQSVMPTDTLNNQSGVAQNRMTKMYNSNNTINEIGLLSSLSQRNYSGCKQGSMISKRERDCKSSKRLSSKPKGKNIKSKKFSNCEVETKCESRQTEFGCDLLKGKTERSGLFNSSQALQKVYRRTYQVLNSYRIREQSWAKEKIQLLSQIEKYKRKLEGKSITTVTSIHNSNKLLL